MTEKAKAKALIEKYGILAADVVDEIITENDNLDLGYNDSNEIGSKMDGRHDYWQQVKTAIIKFKG